MKALNSRFLSFVMAITALIALSGCDPSDDYDDYYVLGTWTASYAYDYYQGGSFDLYPEEVDQFTFNENGRGTYVYYDQNAHAMRSMWLEWYQNRNNSISVRYETGDMVTLYYDFDNQGYLMLTQDPSFSSYTAYRHGI